MKKRFLGFLLILSMTIAMFQVPILALNGQPSVSSGPDKVAMENPFSDVSEIDWFYDAVGYVYRNNIFNGTGVQVFLPFGTMTRGMYVTVMGRIAEIDSSGYSGNGGFTDVSQDAWYAPYVVWAAEKGITTGVGKQRFDPDGLVTREQMAVFTVRFFDTYGISYPETKTLSKPTDFDHIADYAQDAVMKLWHCGLLQGDSKSSFNPKSNATRAEAAAFCMRTDETIERWMEETGLQLGESDQQEVSPTPEPVQQDKPVSKLSPTPVPKHSDESDSDDEDTAYYIISFDSNGGGTIPAKTNPRGTILRDLPVPFKLNSVFSGWYYDETLQLTVRDTDTLKENITLYAKYSEVSKLEEAESPQFASKLDQPVNFSFVVLDPSGNKTAADIKAAITAKNITNPTQTDIIEVTGSNGFFTVSAVGGVFKDGATYKVTLEDETLLFEGYGDSIRNFNFTTAKEEVLNLSLDEGLIYVAANDVSDMTLDGGSVSTLSIPVATAGNDPAVFILRSGTFTYTKSTLSVGDTIAIYSGVRPDQRSIHNNSAEGEVAYVQITQVNGTTYSYKSAQAEEVLFTPDVLPANSADDEDTSGTTFTVDKEKMFFGDDAYAAMGLNATTTVDAGDYLAFYTGTFGDPGAVDVAYGRITNVSEDSESNYIITYVAATENEIVCAMDIYNTQDVDGETLLEGADVQSLEENISKQAMDSGFAQEAASYLTALTLETNTFADLSNDFNLRDYSITLDGRTPVSKGEIALMYANGVSVENLQVHADIGTKLQHFGGISGLRCALEVSFDIEISTGDESKIVIRVTGTFEEEVRVALNVSGGAIWKQAWIIPYIADYRLNANIDLYNFTGVGIHATVATLEKDEEWPWDNTSLGQSIAKELKELLDAKDKYIGDGVGTVADGLTDKYSAMLQNESDWVELFSQDIFTQEGSVDPFHILAYEISLKFVVSANMNISIGCDFYYENAKRYNYSIGLFSEECTNDVIDLVEEHYEFSFYVMGTMGLRAGVRLEIKVGLFSTKLGSVGISAEVGVYVRVWGYFYYELTYRASEGKKTRYAGALLFELGIYLEICFEAQAFNGTFSYTPTLYENEWPLWSAGSRENVQDFAYGEHEAPELALKKHIQTLTVPESIFEMRYLDLKTGDVEEKIYDDASNFTIAITNNAFSYNTTSNIFKVSPEPGDIIEEGQMLITWKNAPLSFTSAPITRIIPLHWDNLNDGYSISFNTGGGSVVPMIVEGYKGSVTPPANPVKTGYVFGGWYADDALTIPYSIPTVMPNRDVVVYARWNPATDTKYTVEHYLQNLNNTLYSLADTDMLYGTTDSTVSPLPRTYPGFGIPAVQNLTIKPDGSAVLRYYYTRNSYTLTFEPGTAGGDSIAYRLKYGAAVYAPQMNSAGYDFAGWNKIVEKNMPANDLAYIAQWTIRSDTAYRVEHYLQKASGEGYMLSAIDNRTGETGATLALEDLKITGDGLTYLHGTVDGSQITSTAITGDGSLVVKLYYDRNTYTVTWQIANGTNQVTAYRYGAVIGEPEPPVKPGYLFSGWYCEEALKTSFVFGSTAMPAKNISLYGKLSPSEDIPYRVEHYVEQLNGVYALQNTEDLTGTADIFIALSDLVNDSLVVEGGITYREGKVKGITQTDTIITADGSLVIQLYYQRHIRTLTFKPENGSEDVVSTVRYGAGIHAPTNPVRAGYVFAGWNMPVALTMPASDVTYTAVWTAKTDTAYKVEHYRQNTDNNGYTLYETELLSGTTDAQVTAEPKTYTGFTSNASADGTVASGTITADCSLMLKLYYDRNTYTITFLSDGAQYGDVATCRFGASITLPSGLVKEGYDFNSWQLDGQPFNGFMPEKDILLTAKWIAREKSYIVRYYQQNLNGNFDSVEAENKTGIYDSEITVTPEKSYTGFTAPASQTITLNSSLAYVDFYYTRNSYTLSWDVGSGTASGNYTGAGLVKYGAPLTPPVLTKMGYSYTWDEAVALTMPANEVTYTALWTAKTDTVYKVEHYRQNANDNGYTLYETETLSGTTDATVVAEAKTYTGFTNNDGIDGTVSFGIIAADGSLTLKLYYDRNSFTVTYMVYQTQYGEIEAYKFEAIVTDPPAPVQTGYDFDSWQLGGQPFNGIMPAYDIVLNAKWSAGEKSYTVRYYQENLNSGFDSVESIPKTDTYDTEIIVTPEKSYTGFTAPESQTVTLNSSLSYVDLYYTRNNYTLSWNLGEGTAGGNYTAAGLVKYGASVTPPVLSKTGYSYTWDEAVSTVMPANDVTYTAIWTANTDTVYKVEHYRQNADDNGYTLYETETLSGTTDTTAIAGVKTYMGFTNNADADGTSASGVISGNGSLTLRLYYDRNIYSVTFLSDGTQYGELVTYRYGATVTLPSGLVKEGYDFDSWQLDGQPFDGFMPEEDIQLTAKWSAREKSYTIRYYQESLNGSFVSVESVSKTGTYDSEITVTPEKSYTGFTTPGSQTVTLNSSLAYVDFKYARNNYTLSWNMDEGMASGDYTGAGSMKYGASVTPPVLTKTGYSYTWDNAVAATMPANDVTYTAIWTANSYAITFETNDGSAVASITNKHYGDVIAAPAEPTRTGYTFGGWYSDSSLQTTFTFTTMPAQNITLYAGWNIVHYNIAYMLDGGLNHGSNPVMYTVEGTVTLGTPTRTGHTFAGWYTNSSLTTPAGSPAITTGSTENKTFYAKWTANTYSILYSGLNGASNSNPSQFTYGSEVITLSDPGGRSGYTFAGWYQGENYITQIQTSSTNNVTITAVWTVNHYSITYYLGGGTNAPGNPPSYTVENAVTLGNPTRTGYTFAGWYTDSGFTMAAGSPAIALGGTGNRSYYAKWTPNTYTVIFNANGGSGSMGNQPFTYDTEQSLSANSFSHAGYTFSGWATSTNGTKLYNNAQTVNNLTTVNGGTITLYAKWNVVTYSISYILNSGLNGSNPVAYTVESATINLANPTRAGYVFGGWFDNSGFSGSAVTVIPAGSTGNKTFYAQWLNYGTFTVTNNGSNTFTITRTGGTDGDQKVYYRTLNGSAIGGTHFNHAAGSVILPAGQTSTTVTVTEYGVTATYSNKAATAYSNVDRVYFFDIYQVDGGGTMGGTTRATRIMAKNSGYIVNADYINNYYQIASVNSTQAILESAGIGDYKGTVAIGLSSPVLSNSAYAASLQAYIRATASGMKIQLRNFNGNDEGWKMWHYVLFNNVTGNVLFSSDKGETVPNLPSVTKCALIYGVTSNADNTERYSVQLPANKGIIPAIGTSQEISIFDIVRASGQTGTDYVTYGLDETCGITAGTYNSALQDSWWVFNSAALYACPLDTTEPQYLDAAPMASSDFKIGDRVTVSLVFDEIVNSAANVSVNTNLSDTAFTLTGGLGTNVLYFEGTVTNTAPSLSVTAINNQTNIRDVCN